MFSDAAARLAGLAGAVLGWRPDEFWRATPAELSAVLSTLVGQGAAGATADDLARLMEMFPDDDDFDEAVVAVRVDRAAFAGDVKAMLAELEGPFADGAYRAGRVLERSLIAAIRSGQTGFEDLKRTALGVLAEIAAASIRGGLNALLNGGKKGGIGVSLAQLFAAVAGAPGKAIGGPVSPGRPYLVGERGPELFVPAASGRIEPMRAGGGGREVQVNVTINAPAGGEARALQASGRQVARAVKAALMRVED